MAIVINSIAAIGRPGTIVEGPAHSGIGRDKNTGVLRVCIAIENGKAVRAIGLERNIVDPSGREWYWRNSGDRRARPCRAGPSPG